MWCYKNCPTGVCNPVEGISPICWIFCSFRCGLQGKSPTSPNTAREMGLMLQMRNGPATDEAIKRFNLDSSVGYSLFSQIECVYVVLYVVFASMLIYFNFSGEVWIGGRRHLAVGKCLNYRVNGVPRHSTQVSL